MALRKCICNIAITLGRSIALQLEISRCHILTTNENMLSSLFSAIWHWQTYGSMQRRCWPHIAWGLSNSLGCNNCPCKISRMRVHLLVVDARSCRDLGAHLLIFDPSMDRGETVLCSARGMLTRMRWRTQLRVYRRLPWRRSTAHNNWTYTSASVLKRCCQATKTFTGKFCARFAPSLVYMLVDVIIKLCLLACVRCMAII